MTLTKHELKKKLAEVNRLSQTIPIGGTGSITETGDNTSNEGIIITTAKIVKVQNDKVITKEGQKADLYSPLPCLYWKCLGTPDKDGIITLRKQLDGLFIQSDDDWYCLGVRGDSDEFELRCVIGSTELRLNKDFLNMISTHIVRNGVEVK